MITSIVRKVGGCGEGKRRQRRVKQRCRPGKVQSTESSLLPLGAPSQVQGLLSKARRQDIEVEIVFPVASKSISTAEQLPGGGGGSAPLQLPGGLAVLPGPASGEGCSLEGGCAACPYMRLNTLAALCGVAEKAGSAAGEALLTAYRPRPYAELINGKTIARAGCVPILHMRHFQKHKKLGDALIDDIRTRRGAAAVAAAN